MQLIISDYVAIALIVVVFALLSAALVLRRHFQVDVRKDRIKLKTNGEHTYEHSSASTHGEGVSASTTASQPDLASSEPATAQKALPMLTSTESPLGTQQVPQQS